MTKIPFIILLMCVSLIKVTIAQDALTYATENKKPETESRTIPPTVFEFNGYSREYELNTISVDMAGEHIFGELIARKIYLLHEKYTSEVAIIPGNPQTKTVIQKPAIYDAVKRIEKYLKKSVKKGELTVADATYTFNKVLDVALSIVTADTKNFEAEIGLTNTEAAKIELFTSRVNLIY